MPPEQTCSEAAPTVPYEPNLLLEGQQGVRVTLVASSPAPPSVGTHTWTLYVEGPQRVPLVEAEVDMTLLMPEHHHGSTLIPRTRELGAGSYEVSPVHFQMSGYWKIQVAVTHEQLSDRVDLRLCIP